MHDLNKIPTTDAEQRVLLDELAKRGDERLTTPEHAPQVPTPMIEESL